MGLWWWWEKELVVTFHNSWNHIFYSSQTVLLTFLRYVPYIPSSPLSFSCVSQPNPSSPLLFQDLLVFFFQDPAQILLPALQNLSQYSPSVLGIMQVSLFLGNFLSVLVTLDLDTSQFICLVEHVFWVPSLINPSRENLSFSKSFALKPRSSGWNSNASLNSCVTWDRSL